MKDANVINFWWGEAYIVPSHAINPPAKKAELIEELTNPKRELLLTLGAGDIDQFVEPLKKYYINEMD